MGDSFFDAYLEYIESHPDPYLEENRKVHKKDMSNNTSTVFASGKIYWAKIVGDQALHLNYDGDSRQWAYEFVPDDTSFLKEHGLLDRLKDKHDDKNPDKGEYLVLRKPEFDREGNKNDPIRIYDEDNQPWDDRLLGNGTKVDIKLRIVDWGRGKKKGIYTTAIRVTELVPYVSNEFGAMDEAKEEKPAKKPNTKGKKASFDDLDDDIPF